MFMKVVYYVGGACAVVPYLGADGAAASPAAEDERRSALRFQQLAGLPEASAVSSSSRLVRREAASSSAARRLLEPTSLSEVERASRGELIPGISNVSMEEEARWRQQQSQSAGVAAALPTQLLAAVDTGDVAAERVKRMYSIQGGSKGLYCSDHSEEAVTCMEPAIGIWEMFQIYHWSRAPHLHVIKGGHGQKWCRDHGDHLACNKDVISTTEEFSISQAGEHKVLRGHERDQWCKVTETGDIACNVNAITDDPELAFSFREIPNAGRDTFDYGLGRR